MKRPSYKPTLGRGFWSWGFLANWQKAMKQAITDDWYGKLTAVQFLHSTHSRRTKSLRVLASRSEGLAPHSEHKSVKRVECAAISKKTEDQAVQKRSDAHKYAMSLWSLQFFNHLKAHFIDKSSCTLKNDNFRRWKKRKLRHGGVIVLPFLLLSRRLLFTVWDFSLQRWCAQTPQSSIMKKRLRAIQHQLLKSFLWCKSNRPVHRCKARISFPEKYTTKRKAARSVVAAEDQTKKVVQSRQGQTKRELEQVVFL